MEPSIAKEKRMFHVEISKARFSVITKDYQHNIKLKNYNNNL
jgi:hypothetical protein